MERREDKANCSLESLRDIKLIGVAGINQLILTLLVSAKEKMKGLMQKAAALSLTGLCFLGELSAQPALAAICCYFIGIPVENRNISPVHSVHSEVLTNCFPSHRKEGK